MHEKSGVSWLQTHSAFTRLTFNRGRPKGISLVGIEPTATRLKGGRSTTELQGLVVP